MRACRNVPLEMSVLKRRSEYPDALWCASSWRERPVNGRAEGRAAYLESGGLGPERVRDLLVVRVLLAELDHELPCAEEFAVHVAQ